MLKPRIRQNTPLVFAFEGKYQVYSPSLEGACVRFENEAVSISGGVLTIKKGMRWRSFTMASHNLLVFVGLSPLGELSFGLPYGVPTSTKASMLNHQLILHRKDLGLSRHQVAQIFVDDLFRAGYPGARFVGIVARCFMPRRGWQVRG
jgi:hypothetical protein